MRILAINGSPKGSLGNTDILPQPFLSGAKDAGADIDMIYLNDKKFNHSKGCFSCMQNTPGVGTQDDDMMAHVKTATLLKRNKERRLGSA